MAYSLDSIMSSVVDCIATMTGSVAVTHVIERAGIERCVSPPYIVWIEQDQDTFDDIKNLGPYNGHQYNPRALWTVRTGVDIHIWASTREQVETLRGYEIAALHRACHGSYSIRSGRRVAANNALMADGYGYILSIELRQPISDMTYSTVTVSTVLHSTIVEFATTSTSCGHLTLSGV